MKVDTLSFCRFRSLYKYNRLLYVVYPLMIMFVPYVKFHGLLQNNTRTIFFFHPSHFFKSYEYFLCILLSSLFLLFASIDWLLFVKQPYEHANQHPACLPKLAKWLVLFLFFAVSAMQYMKMFRYRSDGLGGHFGLSCSPRLGVKKRVTKHYIHILLYNMILFFLVQTTILSGRSTEYDTRYAAMQ